MLNPWPNPNGKLQGFRVGVEGRDEPNSCKPTFEQAGAAGYQAVWGVAHALHTPLMSVFGQAKIECLGFMI